MLRLIILLALLANASHAQDWGAMATISSTMGVQGGKLCLGEASRGDIGCPAYAPSVATNGTLTATNFVGNGSGLTNLPTTVTDRIISNTTSVATTSSGLINLTTNGITTGYFDTLGRLVAPGISITTAHGISSTNGYFSGYVGMGTPSPNVKLHLRGSTWKESAITLEQSSSEGRAYSLSSRPSGTFIIGDEVSASARVTIDKEGNVGIGSSAPISTFQIRNSIIFDEGRGDTTKGADIRMTAAGLIATDDSLHINIDATNTNAGGLYINKGSPSATSATNLLALSNAGNLTLGYADAITDTRLLTIKSAGYTGIIINGDTTNISGEPGGAYVAFALDGNRPAGTHYIGMTNRHGENPKGVSTTGALGNSLMLGTEYADGNGNLQFAPGNSVNMTMLGTNGNIGIGKTNPVYPLDVSGTVKATAFSGDGSQLTNLPTGGIPTGAIMAFDLATCPTGWSEYTPARGRFLRGIDSTGSVDPDGVRTAGSFQADENKSHTHTGTADSAGAHTHSYGANDVGASGTGRYVVGSSATSFNTSSNGNHTHTLTINADGAAEARPKNVAVLYCRKD